MAMIRPETEMKDSGVKYIGLIPRTWKIVQLKYCTDCLDGKRVPIDASLRKSGIYPYWGAGRIMDYVDDYIFDERLVLLGEDGAPFFDDFRPVSHLIDGKVWVNNHIHVLRTKDNVVDSYLVHALNSVDYHEYINGSILNKLTQSNMNRIKIPLPSYIEQQAIADYLDETCSKIDEIIAEAKASIDEYKELKQAVIFDGISLGTKSCCEYKKTTLEGIKKIPVAWEYRKLKFLIKYIESGVSVNAGNEPATELEYGVLKTSCVSKMFFIPSENKSVNKDEYARVKCPVCGNTIIVSRMNTPDLVGACAYIEKNINNIFLPDRLWQVHFNDDVNVKYVYYCLISPYIRNYYSSLSTGTSSSMQNISQGQFANAIIPYPSLEEQKEIVEFLDKRTAEIDSLIAEKESLINDLEAYKKSLIYEVVTGKRRVV